MALQAVSTGSGVAIVLESFAQSFLERGQVVAPIADKLAIRPAHFLVQREGSESRDEIRAFSNWVRTIYSETSS